MLKIHFEYFLNLLIVGHSKENLDLKTDFQANKCLVKISFKGDEPVELHDNSLQERYSRNCTSLIFEISPKESQIERFELLIKDKTKWSELLKILISILNKVLQSIRNFGMVPQIQEVHPQEHEIESYFSGMHVKYSEDGIDYQDVLPPENEAIPISIRKSYLNRFSKPVVQSFELSDIKEAIQDKLEPLPEQEFLTNAIELLRINNLRMALLESIICLEIVVTQYLKVFLEVKKRIPPKQIEEFLNYRLDLTARVSGLLYLTLSEDDLKHIDIKNILEAIKWRNSITHKSGNLPSGLSEDKIRQGIESVVKLALLLAEKRDQIKLEPELQEIAKKISTEYKIFSVNIKSFKKHRILVEAHFYLSSDIPQKNILEKILLAIIEELKTRDKRFCSEQHLFVRFFRFPRIIIARWEKGVFNWENWNSDEWC